ncbi:hypothetical protein [Blastopirellula marina]|uniref:hypothetical protein n=1 Tax=Blastopirellula marina TaxID=124 RepID=UPI0011B01D22|nr:hypothetical protein [Blastopirellula marina]
MIAQINAAGAKLSLGQRAKIDVSSDDADRLILICYGVKDDAFQDATEGLDAITRWRLRHVVSEANPSAFAWIRNGRIVSIDYVKFNITMHATIVAWDAQPGQEILVEKHRNEEYGYEYSEIK